MKQRRSWLAVLMLAGSYTSYNIGSAFASGNEALQFFGSFGGYCPYIMIGVCILITAVTAYMMYAASYTKGFTKANQGIPVIDLKQKENARCTVEIEDGEVFKKINTWELVRDADAIITVPVMKTHDQTEVTLGMKNLKGLLVDTQKKDFHKKGLIEGVVDWNLHLKPCLEIIDGTYGQQGLGPIFGETKKMDLIVGSKDLVACEAVTSKIMGYEPKEVMITNAAYKRGFGEMDLGKIEVIGETIEGVASRFKRSSEVEIEGIPASFNLIFSKDACTGCHNTVISSLMDMKAQNLFPYLENMNVCVGPVTEDMLPADANADNTVCIGVCCKKLADAKGFRWVVGCPPGNADVVKGILGDRKEYGVRYE